MKLKLDTNKFSLRLRELMKEKGLTTYSLGDIIYLTPSAISRYINAKMSPKRTTIEVLAKHFNVDTLWLMGISDERDAYLSNENLKNSQEQEKRLILSDDQILLLLNCIKIQQVQSKLLTGKENFQLSEIEMILGDYRENNFV